MIQIKRIIWPRQILKSSLSTSMDTLWVLKSSVTKCLKNNSKFTMRMKMKSCRSSKLISSLKTWARKIVQFRHLCLSSTLFKANLPVTKQNTWIRQKRKNYLKDLWFIAKLIIMIRSQTNRRRRSDKKRKDYKMRNFKRLLKNLMKMEMSSSPRLNFLNSCLLFLRKS